MRADPGGQHKNHPRQQPSEKRFTVRRIVGGGNLWITEYILSYDGKPSFTVSIMEFNGNKVARETPSSSLEPLRQRRSNPRCDAPAIFRRPQIIGDFQLRSPSRRTAIANIQGMTSRVAMPIGYHREARPAQMLSQAICELHIQPADKDLSIAHATVNADHDIPYGRHGDALRMIEPMAGDMQSAVLTVGLHSLEAEQTVVLARDELCDVGGSGFDLAPMRRENNRRRLETIQDANPKILALCLVLRQFSERRVPRHIPIKSIMRYANTDGARNQGFPK